MSNARDLIIDIDEVSGLGVIDLRLLPEDETAMKAAGDALGLTLPTMPRRAETQGDVTALWFSIDHWLVIIPKADLAATIEKLKSALTGMHSSVVDVSSLRTILSLKGEKVREVLTKCSSTNLYIDEYQLGFVRRMAIADQGVAIHVVNRDPDEIHLFIFRSYTHYVRQWVTEAAHKDRAIGVNLG